MDLWKPEEQAKLQQGVVLTNLPALQQQTYRMPVQPADLSKVDRPWQELKAAELEESLQNASVTT